MESDQAKAAGNQNWYVLFRDKEGIIYSMKWISNLLFQKFRWKAHEAAMLALGSVQEVIERQIKAGKVEFDIPGK